MQKKVFLSLLARLFHLIEREKLFILLLFDCYYHVGTERSEETHTHFLLDNTGHSLHLIHTCTHELAVM